MIIKNGSSIPLNQNAGNVPNLAGAMQGWFQPITFTPVTKSTDGFQVIEVGTPFGFIGVVQPFSARQLQMKPIGERQWKWIMVHSTNALPLSPDDVIVYLGVQYRVMSDNDYSIYGYFQYELKEDYTGSGPA